jgi:hypothetical protein
VSELGRGSRSVPLAPLTLATPFLFPWSAAAPLLPFAWPLPPLPLLLPQELQPPPHKTLAAPIPPPLQGAALPLGSPSCGCELSIGVWREEEGRRKGRTQGEFVIIFCCLCAAIKLIMCLSMRIGRGAVQKFCGWANSSSSSDFWEFSWVN